MLIKFCEAYLCPLWRRRGAWCKLFPLSRSNVFCPLWSKRGAWCRLFPLPRSMHLFCLLLCKGTRVSSPTPSLASMACALARSLIPVFRSMVESSLFIFNLIRESLENINGVDTTSKGLPLDLLAKLWNRWTHCCQNSMPPWDLMPTLPAVG